MSKKSFLDRTDGPTLADHLPLYLIGGIVGVVAIVALAGIVVAVLAMVVMAGCVCLVAIGAIKK